MSVPISIINDSVVEQLREQFSLNISITPQPGLSLGNSQGAVTIVDDDGMLYNNIMHSKIRTTYLQRTHMLVEF